MKILLVQSMEYLYPWGGAHKANRILMEGLAARGHQCLVITPSLNVRGYAEFLQTKVDSGEFDILEDQEDLFTIRQKAVTAHTVKGTFKVFPFLKSKIEQFQPDITIVSEDNTHMLLETVLETRVRTVFLAHSQATLPFGPESFQEDSSKLGLYKQLHGILSVSQYLKNYFWTYAGIDSKVIYFPSYGPSPFPYLGHFDNKYVTVINPSAIKGISIFIGLARVMPHVAFAAVPTWATTDDELDALRSIPNITVLEPSENINDIYKLTKVFLMPSLWGESFGQVVVEAMLRGIPVIASHVGGLPEAKLGLDYILPVQPIKQYINESVLASKIPVPVIPEQDLEPWRLALSELVDNRVHYDALSMDSYDRSRDFHAQLGIEPFEIYLQELVDTTTQNISSIAPSSTDKATSKIMETISNLSLEQRARLLTAIGERRAKG
ncbi:glycosyltransferase [Paenibacillus sp. 19GGS1-52]|uniref:glycosyltransferase family 4 protein n=1 Tax=Paenibacillus sp. 19GGS1-52 TaxID=2758563 RepID=UPI001EFAF29C|nr:glycosyltransferase family 4 protein [Paenibacillus sp. 19GGS1-52]ULO04703.1 glycosyltransferase [Paenibacillus sp. 19GGS1-52]